MADMIKSIIKMEKIQLKDFNVIFSAALKLLFYDKQIIKSAKEQYSVYELTTKGYNSIQKMIDYCTKDKISDRIRIEIMYYNLYKAPHS